MHGQEGVVQAPPQKFNNKSVIKEEKDKDKVSDTRRVENHLQTMKRMELVDVRSFEYIYIYIHIAYIRLLL